MPERLAADKKQKIASAHADLVAALQERAVSLTDEETSRLREKLAAYIDKTNPEQVDIPRLANEITEKIRNPRTRARWFAPDKTEKIQRTYADLVAALQERAVSLTDNEPERLRKKLAASSQSCGPPGLQKRKVSAYEGLSGQSSRMRALIHSRSSGWICRKKLSG